MLLINKRVQLIFLNKVDKVVHFRSQNMCKFIRIHCLPKRERERERERGGGEDNSLVSSRIEYLS